jgi:hypothetical protein
MYALNPLLSLLSICTPTGCELTGDTVQSGTSAWGEAKKATVM